MRRLFRPLFVTGLAALLAAAAAAMFIAPIRSVAANPVPLWGKFSITAGVCPASGAPTTGSYFQMTSGATVINNTSSTCQSGKYTLLKQGTAGLVTGAYQLDPNPSFTTGGNSTASAIITPVAFFGVKFGLATTCADQQRTPTATGSCPVAGKDVFSTPLLDAQPPGVGGCPSASTTYCIFGTLDGLGVTYNGTAGDNCANESVPGTGCYDQGAAVASNQTTMTCPQGGTGCSLKGTFNPSTLAYSLTWHSTIIGGPFNGKTGNWVFRGKFTVA